jgi:hypothetical protein
VCGVCRSLFKKSIKFNRNRDSCAEDFIIFIHSPHFPIFVFKRTRETEDVIEIENKASFNK